MSARSRLNQCGLTDQALIEILLQKLTDKEVLALAKEIEEWGNHCVEEWKYTLAQMSPSERKEALAEYK